jgi:hypothetical protein
MKRLLLLLGHMGVAFIERGLSLLTLFIIFSMPLFVKLWGLNDVDIILAAKSVQC